MLTPVTKELVVAGLQTRFNAWAGFDDPRFLADEVDYKRKIIANASPFIERGHLQKLLDTGKYDDFTKQLANAAQKSVNLLYLSTPKSGDLRILSGLSPAQRPDFCRAFFNLLYGDGTSAQRFGQYVNYLNSAKLPNYWTFPTYFLFITNPGQDIFVKPRTLHTFFKYIQLPSLWSSTPTADAYSTILGIAEELRGLLREFGPEDMVDIQSAIYVCGDSQSSKPAPNQAVSAAPELTLGHPFSQIFTSYSEADAAFDLLRLTFEYLGVESEEDESFALTIPRSEDKCVLRLNFGTWAIVGFYGPENPNGHVIVVTMKKDLPGLTSVGGEFDQKPSEVPMRFYGFPFTEIHRLTDDLAGEYEESLRFIGQRFSGRQRCLFRQSNLPIVARAVFHPEQRQGLLTGGTEMAKEKGNNSVFSEQSFELLAGIHATPQVSYYQANQPRFRQYVEEPLQSVMLAVAAGLPPTISTIMETDRRIFGRFRKNDFGLRGAWPYYWGAFYPKGGKRKSDAQLSMWMNFEMLEYGFHIGEYSSTQHQRFVRNCASYRRAFEEIMESLFDSQSVFFGDRENFVVTDSGGASYKDGSRPTWGDFLADPQRFNCDASLVLSRSNLLQLEQDELTRLVLNAHMRLFPLVLAATADDPLPLIEQYLASQFPDDVEPEIQNSPNPIYTLEQMTAATGFPMETIAGWVNGIKRKKQAILYGPPGTGKTFLAKHLASHLIGGGDGITDIVQFHPAYAYEDFMQGLRPRPHPSGGLEYPVVQGRFLEFCSAAGMRHGPCVLIIDEVNRANLARVFGELMYLLEYRDQDIPLAAGGQRFRIPDNVFIIGTMNTADRSIALVDHALRRRFAFLEVRPEYEVLRRYLALHAPDFPRERLIQILERLNQQIDEPHYEVGISYFMSKDISTDLRDIWRMEIQPYLDEYFFDRRETAAEFAWDKIWRDQ